MALASIHDQYANRDNDFYKHHYSYFYYAAFILLFTMILSIGVLLYQVLHRPLPPYHAVDDAGKTMELVPFTEPSMLPSTIIRFASKAAIMAYTLNFNDYEAQLEQVRPYFTNAGWTSFRASMNDIINKIIQAKLFVNGAVVGTPVISNQGELPGQGYVWRVQIPFVGSYSNGETETHRNFYVIISIVKVSTAENPQGMGIDQFVMTGG